MFYCNLTHVHMYIFLMQRFRINYICIDNNRLPFARTQIALAVDEKVDDLLKITFLLATIYSFFCIKSMKIATQPNKFILTIYLIFY